MFHRGYKTTEFWTWVVTMVMSTASSVATVYVAHNDPWVDVLVYGFKAVIDATTTCFYIWARGKAKQAHAELIKSDPLLHLPPSE